MATKPVETGERTAFFADLDRRRRVSAGRIGVALLAWAVIYGVATALWEPKAQAHVYAQVIGDLALLVALGVAFTTPWTTAQREAQWLRRMRRKVGQSEP